MAEVVFEVLGRAEPADFRIGRWGAYQKPSVKEFKAEVRRCAAEAMAGRSPLSGPLQCAMCFVRAAPKSDRRANGEFKVPSAGNPYPWAWMSKPDWDNLCKSAQDACSKVVWNDDAQIVWGQPIKVQDDHHRIIIRVREVCEADMQMAYSQMVGALRRSRGVPEEGTRAEVEADHADGQG